MSIHKGELVAVAKSRSNGNEEWDLVFSRVLFQWELEELKMMKKLLQTAPDLRNGVLDGLYWAVDKSGVFTVASVYKWSELPSTLLFDGGGEKNGILGIVVGMDGIEGIVVGMVGSEVAGSGGRVNLGTVDGIWVVGSGGNVDGILVVGSGGNVGIGKLGIVGIVGKAVLGNGGNGAWGTVGIAGSGGSVTLGIDGIVGTVCSRLRAARHMWMLDNDSITARDRTILQ
ncbi:hypothetical protein LOK49_LG01G02222 [Camellia lanceoleosa]|uniref:Uncharacterized protein n=1 Tax=Camellia lanceoleosa TaxID=1840588 RepID=A0ACC0IY26_9ERIC|nr:hypothetical protein LOK49_LG01G02222 [Camellia lanceoleosa]